MRPAFRLFTLLLLLANHATAAPIVRVGEDRPGQVLVSELSCNACHEGGVEPKSGPDLRKVGERIQPDYLVEFIANPLHTKPGTTMPNVFGSVVKDERQEVAEAISEYLQSLSEKPVRLEPIEPAAIERGRDLYHRVGCVACHSPEEKALPDSAPLHRLEDKYSVASLGAFLEDPLAVRPSGRMPDLQLTHWEALDIAAYLLREQKQKPLREVKTTRAAEGKILFEKHGCVQCHDMDSSTSALALPLVKAPKGKTCTTANYGLSQEQTKQIDAVLGTASPTLEPEVDLALTMTRLGCVACHDRNGRGGVADDRDQWFSTTNLNLGEQARIPPSLSGVGAKLKPAWLRKVVVSGASVRPYLDTRMPLHGRANVEPILEAFEKLDSLEELEFTRVKDQKVARQAGADLAGSKNLSCVACHTWKGESATTLKGLEMTSMADRLQENWFHHYMRNPQAFHPSTIMPGFWPGGKTTRPEILEGDTDQQIDALWQYLTRGKEARTPAGIRREPIEYGPTGDEAVMLRRQYNGIGKRGIGVGYPSGINLAFDATQMRLATLWKGDFGEMSGVWRGQGSGNVGERSREVVRFLNGPGFALLETPASPWPVLEKSKKAENLQFKGYELDEKQRPTFQYHFGDLEITDGFVDQTSGPSLARTLRFNEVAPAGLHLRVATGKELKRLPNNQVQLGQLLTIELPEAAILRDGPDGNRELLLPVGGLQSVEIQYQFEGTP